MWDSVVFDTSVFLDYTAVKKKKKKVLRSHVNEHETHSLSQHCHRAVAEN